MLRNVIIMTHAGVVIFEKVWGQGFGQLVATMQEFSKQSTSMVVSYLEFGEVAMSIVDNAKTGLICTLFHETKDGADFGQLIAGQILRSFLDTFPEVSFKGTLNVATFSGFVSKVFDAIVSSVRSIVQELEQVRGINNALVVYDDMTAVMASQADEDQVGLVANLQPLLSISNDILETNVKETPQLITLELSRQRVVLHRVSDTSLVVICRKNVKSTVYTPAIVKAVDMLEKVFALIRALNTVSHEDWKGY